MSRLIEVDDDTAQRFIEAGGTIHVHPKGYAMHAGHSFTIKNFATVQAAKSAFRQDGLGVPILLIYEDDPHPANPLRV